MTQTGINMNPKVLLVDDEPKVLASLRRTLRDRFDLTCATSGEEALALLQSQGPFAAVVSDMRMPGMSGLELLIEMRKRAPETVRLVLSGHADFSMAVAAVNEGAIFRFHTKPVSADLLAESLECALLRHREEQEAGGRIDPGQGLVREVAAFRNALAEHQIRLFLQPQYRLHDGVITGAEALARWQHPDQGLLQPGEFLAAAEAGGLMEDLTTYMLERACAEIRHWMDSGVEPVRVAINGTARNLSDPDFPRLVGSIIAKHDVPSDLIEIELTESTAVEDIVGTQAVVKALAGMGVSTSIDDFGTGHASLGWLRHFPVSKLKIDRIFIEDIVDDGVAYRLLENIVRMAHDLNLSVLAEGIETPGQMDLVRRVGCDIVQGFLVARPMPAESFPGWRAKL